MLDRYTSMAILAKARGMFGKSLRRADYMQLVRMRSVNDIAAYLKNDTVYASCLSHINENTIHRGQLENLLRRNILERYGGLYRFAPRSQRAFYRFLIMRMEIDEIIEVLGLISAGSAREYITALPTYFNKWASFDLMRLGDVHDVEGLIQALGRTPYAELIRKGTHNGQAGADVTSCEVLLRTYYYQAVFEQIGKDFPKQAREELRRIFLREAELYNISVIWRLKIYYNMPGSYIREKLLPFTSSVSSALLSEIIDAPDEQSTREAIQKVKYAKKLPLDSFVFLEEFTSRIVFDTVRRLIHFSKQPCVVFTAYLFFLEAEIANIVNIIEGVRYQVAPSDIESLLIL